MDAKLAATLNQDPDYSEEKVDYILVNEAKFLDMKFDDTTFLVFNMPPYTPEMVNIGFYCLRRNMMIDVAFYSINYPLTLWMMGMIEEILVKDQAGVRGEGGSPFANLDWVKPYRVSWAYDENYLIWTPIYTLNLFVSHDTL